MKVLWSRKKCLKKFKVFHSAACKHTGTSEVQNYFLVLASFFTSCFLSPFTWQTLHHESLHTLLIVRKELHWKIKSFSLISFLFASSTSHDISFFIELVSIACFIGRSKREEVRTKELLKIYLQTFSHKREISSRKFKFNDKVLWWC